MHALPLQQPPHEVPSQTHAPPEQRCPEAQMVPQPPQLLLSVCSLTHTPLHTDCPNGQTHWPLWQVPPTAQGPHRAPAVPQVEFVWLEEGLHTLAEQQPLAHETPSHMHEPA